MKVTRYFEKAGDRTLVSFEVLPPMKGGSMKAIFDTLDPLMEFKPPSDSTDRTSDKSLDITHPMTLGDYDTYDFGTSQVKA